MSADEVKKPPLSVLCFVFHLWVSLQGNVKPKEDSLHLGEEFLGLMTSPQNVNIVNDHEEYLK